MQAPLEPSPTKDGASMEGSPAKNGDQRERKERQPRLSPKERKEQKERQRAEKKEREGSDEHGEKADDPSNGNAVSLLQEHIQSRSSFSPHAKILTWSHEQRMENQTTLQFRATASFIFADVPHHFCGGWQTSKKKAQRDTAERALYYCQTNGLHHPSVKKPSKDSEEKDPDADDGPREEKKEKPQKEEKPEVPEPDPIPLPQEISDELHKILGFKDYQGGMNPGVQWTFEAGSEATFGMWRATLSFLVVSVPHHFCGNWAPSQLAARSDTAERVLWYFNSQGPDGELFRTPDDLEKPEGSGADNNHVTSAPPAPPSIGQGPVGPEAEKDRQVADDKTILMQVQNQLQKAFSKNVPPGQRVWIWSYEPSETGQQIFRAHVEVPSIPATFHGSWCRGKKLAQRSACLEVKKYLDEKEEAESPAKK